MRRLKSKKIIAGLAAFALAPTFTIASSCSKNSVNEIWQEISVSRVIDGDTFVDNNQVTYRIHGIDSPEGFDKNNDFEPTSGIQKKYADSATKLLSDLILNKKIVIKNITKDQYNRRVVEARINNLDVGKELIENGLCIVAYISPNPKNQYFSTEYEYYKTLLESQLWSFSSKKGIWQNNNDLRTIFPNI